MPQFDPSSFISQLFWLLITFGILFFFLGRIALPRLASVLEQRERVVQDDLERAEALKKEADDAIAAFEAALAEAREQGHAALKAAQDEVSAMVTKRNGELAAEIAERIKTAEARIQSARDEAMNSVQDIATETAVAAVSRLSGVDVKADEAAKTVSALGGNA